MLPVVDKPLIQYGVEEAVQSGIENIAIIISRGKSSIEDYFDKSPELEQFLKEKLKLDLLEEIKGISNLAEFCYIRQKKALGLGHAILMGEDYIGQEPFAVLLPDDIFDCHIPCTKQLVDAYYEVKPGPDRAFSDLGILGRYIFNPEIFEAIKKTSPDSRGEIQITDAIRLLLEAQPVYGYLFEGKRYDAGDKLGFMEAIIDLALKRAEFGQNLREYLKSLL